MKIKFIFLCSATTFVLSFSVFSRNPEWIIYDRSPNEILCIENDGNLIWAGSSDGLIELEKLSGEITFYDTSNSGLPDNWIESIAIDRDGNRWIGTNAGLVLFDGIDWTIYNMDNSGLPSDNINTIEIDENGEKWIGTENGLAKFDGIDWTVYDISEPGKRFNRIMSMAIDGNSNKWIGTYCEGLVQFDGTDWNRHDIYELAEPYNVVRSLAIDNNGDKWIGAEQQPGSGSAALILFDGTDWTVYDRSNSGLPGDLINSIAIDKDGNKWIGTMNGLALFDGNNWTVYNASNSELPDNRVLSIAFDENGNKWIGTGDGLAVYNQGGVVTSIERAEWTTHVPENYCLSQNYPNPFNPSTTIQYDLPRSGHVQLVVYDILGREVKCLLDEQKPTGQHHVIWDATNDNGEHVAAGLYFCCMKTNAYSQTQKMLLVR